MENKLPLVKKLFYLLGALASRIIPLNWLRSITGIHYILPFYHAVSDTPPTHLKNLYPVRSVQQFEDDIKFFKKHFQPTTPQEFYTLFKNKRVLSSPVFLVSFDDGFISFKNQAVPVLQKYGITAVCFINSDFVNNNQIFYRCKASMIIEKLKSLKVKDPDNTLLSKDIENVYAIGYHDQHQLDNIAFRYNIDLVGYFSNESPYLSDKDIISLKKNGFYIGAHSKDHPLYKKISIEEQVHQTLHSLQIVDQISNNDLKLFSFPFTDDGVTKVFFERIKSYIHLSFGTAGMKIDSIDMHLQRIPMEVGNYSAAAIIYGEYLYYLLKLIAGRNIIKR